MGTTRQQAG
ncbi:hypothetical protein E2320_005150, partial [Naja naja]